MNYNFERYDLRQQRCFGVFTVKFEQNPDIVLVLPQLTLSK